MGKPSRDKGNRVEREIVNALRENGIKAERVPLSGAAHGSFSGDLILEGDRCGLLRAEVKARKDGAGFKTIESWKGDNDLLVLKSNRKNPLVVIDFDLFKSLIKN